LPSNKPYTFAIRISQHRNQNCKRVCLANAPQEMKIVANLKDKMTERKECQWVTRNIKNWAEIGKYERTNIK